ncbi:MAG: zf-HC2 domain-containing protein [Candidatus Aminicenantes bacterium]|nr:zf-HC2 domain-containing protein [Candidatus Aminicenantes bacterium]
MSKCRFEELIDGYLLNKLDTEEAERFEEHFFNCSRCFNQLQQREEVIKAIKEHGPALIREVKPAQSRLQRWADEVVMIFANRQWLVAPTIAAFLIVIFLIFSPFSKEEPPSFVLNGENVLRGQAINLISPIIDVNQPPLYFEWKKQGEDLEYKISLYDSRNELLWSSTTKETVIILPEDIRKKMKPGEKYSWQVKAISSNGILVAVSSRVQFMIKDEN